MSRTSVTSRDLAAFLSAQLAPQLHGTGIRIAADGADVVVHDPDGGTSRSGAAGILDDADDGRAVSDRAATAARAVLSHVQDVAAAALGRPWPGGGPELPLPDAQVEDGALVAWFGDRGRLAWSSAALPVEG